MVYVYLYNKLQGIEKELLQFAERYNVKKLGNNKIFTKIKVDDIFRIRYYGSCLILNKKRHQN